jgi:uncharacterized protein with GYD domain
LDGAGSPEREGVAEAGGCRHRVGEQLGAKMDVYYTMGEYDLVVVTQAPNDDTAMQLFLELGKLGNVRTKTLKAWTTAEATKVISKIQ